MNPIIADILFLLEFRLLHTSLFLSHIHKKSFFEEASYPAIPIPLLSFLTEFFPCLVPSRCLRSCLLSLDLLGSPTFGCNVLTGLIPLERRGSNVDRPREAIESAFQPVFGRENVAVLATSALFSAYVFSDNDTRNAPSDSNPDVINSRTV